MPANARLFLDACCIVRQFDDQSQTRIHFETEAVASIMNWVRNGELACIGSEALRFELEQNKSIMQRETVLLLFDTFCQFRDATAEDFTRAGEFQSLGFKAFDALHLAVAESSKCDVFLTTDDRLLKGAQRWKRKLNVAVKNPYDWVLQRLTR